MTKIRDGHLVPRPEFQRRLVWTNSDKLHFIDTVLGGYPFPEIYIAAGDVDLDSGEGTELLVDGQQRVTTLYQYFSGSPDLRLSEDFPSYSSLSATAKAEFLEYVVVVRDLGRLSLDEIRNVFARINATAYSLNAMEIRNARYNGKFKQFAESVSQHDFFDKHRVFNAADIRRMADLRFATELVATIMGSYFNRDENVEEYLAAYNDEFEDEKKIRDELDQVMSFVQSLDLPAASRAWRRSDLFTLLVEIHRALVRKELALEPGQVRKELIQFYREADSFDDDSDKRFSRSILSEYARAALHATTDRGNRIRRGQIIERLLVGQLDESDDTE